MLGGNTNKLVWVGIALGLVGILGGSIMMFYPSAMSTVSDTISTSVSKFMKTDSSKDDDSANSDVPELASVSKEAHIAISTGNSYDSVPSLDSVINSMPDTDTLTVGGHKLTVSNLNRGGSNYYTISNISGDSKIIDDANTMMDSGFKLDSSSYGSEINLYNAGSWNNGYIYSSGVKSQLWNQAMRDVENADSTYVPEDVSFDLGFLVNVTAVDGKALSQQDADGNNMSYFYEIPIHVTIRFK